MPHIQEATTFITTQVPNPNWIPEIIDGGLLDKEGEFTSTGKLDHYFDLRNKTLEVDKVSGDHLAEIQADASAWIHEQGMLDVPEDPAERVAHYTTFSEDKVRARLGGLIDYIEANYPEVDPLEIETSRAFIDSTFAIYSDRDSAAAQEDKAKGGHAFVVPARMSRDRTEYGEEVEPSIPILRYVQNADRMGMMDNLPPFVIDRYLPTGDGRKSYLVYAPVNGNLQMDLAPLGMREMIGAARNNVNEAIDLVYERFGITTAGLGATLPSVTNFGKSIKNPNVTTTTGHGGTIELIMRNVKENLDKDETPRTIGVLGVGAIGAQIAHVAGAHFPESEIKVYDPDEGKIARTLRDDTTGRMSGVTDEKELVQSSDVILSAAAVKEPIDLKGIGITEDDLKKENGEAKLIVDDGQPLSIDPEQAREMGAVLLWVTGRDSTGKVVREAYDYATLIGNDTLFGCEAEAASLSRYKAELDERGLGQGAIDRIISKVAIRGAVSVKQVGYIAALFKKYGIVAAAPQAMGKPVSTDPLHHAA